MRLMVLVLVLGLIGCAQTVEQATDRTGQVLDEGERVIQELGDTADALLARIENALCSKRFSLRAYQSRYGGERWNALVAFCQWDTPPPAPSASQDP